MTYDEAMSRLEDIVSRLETDEAISINEYKQQAEEAKRLLQFCREQLRSIETDIHSLFEDKQQ